MSFLKKSRRRLKLTALDLSKKTGINRANISAVENDLEHLGEDRAKTIGDALGITENVMTVYRGLLPAYSIILYKLFPDVFEKKIRDISKKLIQNLIKSSQELQGDHLKKTIADDKKFFQWLYLSELAVCGSCEKIVEKNATKDVICDTCKLEIERKLEKKSLENDKVQPPTTSEGEKITILLSKLSEKTKLELAFLAKSRAFFEEIQEQHDFDLITCHIEEAMEKLSELNHNLCTMCGEIYTDELFPNGYCQNCNDDIGMTKEDLDELKRLAETSPYQSKKDK